MLEGSTNIYKLIHIMESKNPYKYINDLILKSGNKNLESDLKNMINTIEYIEE